MGSVNGKTTQVIYETKGRAREYNELAINLFTGCGHGCVYCYGADVLMKNREQFYQEPKVRDHILEKIESDCRKLRGEKRSILLCFVTDPYQPIEDGITRKAIEILHFYGLKVIILTKGGLRARRDFDLLGVGDAFATTLTLCDLGESHDWEPGAAPPHERMQSLREAHKKGIETWVSLEPVIDPTQTLTLIETTHNFVDSYKVGTLNYIEKLPDRFKARIKNIDWRKFAHDVKEKLDSIGCKYYLKEDLRRWL